MDVYAGPTVRKRDLRRLEKLGCVIRQGELPRKGRVVLAGGDGTIHAAINRLMPDPPEVAIIPCGSGNDFSKTLAIPSDLSQAVELAQSGRARPIDVGEIDQGRKTWFMNIAQAGFGARVVAHARWIKAITRSGSYKLGIVPALLSHRLRPLSLEIDGRKVGEFLMTELIVANGQYFGGGMRPMPHARPDDGILEVAVLNEFSRWKIITQSGVLKLGLPKNHQRIHLFRGSYIRASSPEEVPLEADGELLGNLPAGFRVHRQGIHIVCP